MNNHIGEIRAMLASIVGHEVVNQVEDQQLRFDQGLIDSLHIVEIVDHFESKFGVEVAGEDLTPENFGSIAGMANLLSAKGVPADSASV